MQRIRLTRGLLTELDRCDKSFVLSLFWHGLDNSSLDQSGGLSADSSDVQQARREMLYNMDGISQSIAAAHGITEVVCDTQDMQEKVDRTMELIDRGEPVVICDGALEGDNFVVPFAVLVIRDDGLWEVYHQSSKTVSFVNAKDHHNALENAYREAAPLMYVLAECYAQKVASFCVVAADKHYLTPYPNGDTGEIMVDPNEVIAVMYLDIYNGDEIRDHLPYEDPMMRVQELQSRLCDDPFWIPTADMGSQCNHPYTCPFYSYCERSKMAETPNSAFFWLSSSEYKKLRKIPQVESSYDYDPDDQERTCETMEDFLALSYEYDLSNVPIDDTGKTVKFSDISLRSLRAYEQNIIDIPNKVRDFLG